MVFEPIRKMKVAEQVASALRRAIVSGHYRAGEGLPSERALAEAFAVNRSSVREALMRLEAWGLVEIRHGDTTRIRDVFRSAGLQLLPYLFAPDGKVNQSLVDDVLAIRGMFLGWTAAQAARAPQAEAAQRLRTLAEALDAAHRAGRPAPELQRLDFDFFAQLVEMTGNRVLRLFANALRDVYAKNGELFLYQYGTALIDAVHQRAAVAIAVGDAAAAQAAMTAYAQAGATIGGADAHPAR
ncbi:MAG: FadR family transcriptional regulator [Myxococcales bacterium]|nr:FadR family transcriptional regulator [Myxococcales bacterium]